MEDIICSKTSKKIGKNGKYIRLVVVESNIPEIEEGSDIHMSEKVAKKFAAQHKIKNTPKRSHPHRGVDRHGIKRSADLRDRAVVQKENYALKQPVTDISRHPIKRGDE